MRYNTSNTLNSTGKERENNTPLLSEQELLEKGKEMQAFSTHMNELKATAEHSQYNAADELKKTLFSEETDTQEETEFLHEWDIKNIIGIKDILVTFEKRVNEEGNKQLIARSERTEFTNAYEQYGILINVLTKKITVSTDAIKSQQQQIAVNEKQISQHNHMITWLQAQASELQSALSQAKTPEAAAIIQAQLEACKAQIEQQEKQRDALIQHNQRLSDQINTLEQRIQERTAQQESYIDAQRECEEQITACLEREQASEKKIWEILREKEEFLLKHKELLKKAVDTLSEETLAKHQLDKNNYKEQIERWSLSSWAVEKLLEAILLS